MDKHRVSSEQAQHAMFKLVDANATVLFQTVSAVVVFPFYRKKLVVVRIKRGIDLPGGHVDSKETNLEQTARRECMEEAAISLTSLKLFGYLESTVTLNGATSYIALFVAAVAELQAMRTHNDAEERLLLDVDEFINCYQGDKHLMMRLLERAHYSLGVI
jgi:8-oxo-dGTP diphosphatase